MTILLSKSKSYLEIGISNRKKKSPKIDQNDPHWNWAKKCHLSWMSWCAQCISAPLKTKAKMRTTEEEKSFTVILLFKHFMRFSRSLALRQKPELRSGRAPLQFSELRSGLRSGWQFGVALRPALRALFAQNFYKCYFKVYSTVNWSQRVNNALIKSFWLI